jgi:X-X-X-Leu-X-X-Gly heptad repeat protein
MKLIYRTGALNYLPRQFFSLRGRGSGTLLYRGYAAASAANPKSSTHSRTASASHSRRPSAVGSKPDKPEAPPGGRNRSSSVFEDLKDGADKLKEGADKLKEGAGKLKEGADKLGKEGIDKLSGKSKQAAMQEEMSPMVCPLFFGKRLANE